MSHILELATTMPPLALHELAAAVETHGSAVVASTTDPPTTWLGEDSIRAVVLDTDARDADACWVRIGDQGETVAYVEVHRVWLDGSARWMVIAAEGDHLECLLWRTPGAAYGDVVCWQSAVAQRTPGGKWREVTRPEDIPVPDGYGQPDG